MRLLEDGVIEFEYLVRADVEVVGRRVAVKAELPEPFNAENAGGVLREVGLDDCEARGVRAAKRMREVFRLADK
jgi:hypothetical protein